MSLESKLDTIEAAKGLSQYLARQQYSHYGMFSTIFYAMTHPLKTMTYIILGNEIIEIDKELDKLALAKVDATKDTPDNFELGITTIEEEYAARFLGLIRNCMRHEFRKEGINLMPITKFEKLLYTPIKSHESFIESSSRGQGNDYYISVSSNFAEDAKKWLCSELYNRLEHGSTVVFLDQIKVTTKEGNLFVEFCPYGLTYSPAKL